MSDVQSGQPLQHEHSLEGFGGFEWVGESDTAQEWNVKRTRDPFAIRIVREILVTAPWRQIFQLSALVSAAIAGRTFDPSPGWIQETERGVLLVEGAASLGDLFISPLFAAFAVALLIISNGVFR